MFNYKGEQSTSRNCLLIQIYTDIKNQEGDENKGNDFFILPEFADFNKDLLCETIELLLDSSKNLQTKDKALIQIRELTTLSHQEVFSFLTPDVLQCIIELAFQNETCQNAFFVLSLFTYYTDFFNDFIITSDLFVFISNQIYNFNEEQLKYCTYLLINLFITIPLEKPLKTKLIRNLLHLELNKINQVPNIICLYSIIIEREDFPYKYFKLSFSIFKNILLDRSNICLKTRNQVLKALNSLLDIKKYSNITANFISTDNLIGPIINIMNEQNFKLCLTIIRKMICINDSFSPQLSVYHFNTILIHYCQSENEDVQCFSLLFSSFYIQCFPDFAKEFLDFQFETVFLCSSFIIKTQLIRLYNLVLPIIISKKVDFQINLTKPFILEIFDMSNDSNDEMKNQVYLFMILIFQYKKSFVLAFDIVDTCVSNEIMQIADEDCFSGNLDLAQNARMFLNSVNETLKQKRDASKSKSVK